MVSYGSRDLSKIIFLQIVASTKILKNQSRYISYITNKNNILKKKKKKKKKRKKKTERSRFKEKYQKFAKKKERLQYRD